MPKWTAIVGDAFPEFRKRIFCFGADWLGRHFALDAATQADGQYLVLMLEPGTGEVLRIPSDFTSFHNEELVNYRNDALASNFFEAWLASEGNRPGLNECIGYRTPLFLGGKDEVSNLELTDMEVYWSICAQLILKVRHLPDGTPIGDVQISD